MCFQMGNRRQRAAEMLTCRVGAGGAPVSFLYSVVSDFHLLFRKITNDCVPQTFTVAFYYSTKVISLNAKVLSNKSS